MKLFYRELGEGPPMVILHGLYGSSDNWVSIGRELSTQYRVILVDQRNHGRSPHSSSHTYKNLSDDLFELFNHLDLQRAILLGHSMGGKAAMLFTAYYPKMVSKLAVADILPFSSTSNENFDQIKIHQNILSSLLMLDPESSTSRESLDTTLSKSITDSAVRQFLLKSLKRNDRGTYSWAINLQSLSNNINELMGAVFPFDGFSKIDVPTLFIKGERSNYIYSKGINELKEYFGNYNLVEVPKAGHWLHAENPSAFIGFLRSFVSSKSV